MNSLPTRPLRALTQFEVVPPLCILYTVTDDRCAPHLCVGEIAIVDPRDVEPQHGELYLFAGHVSQVRRKIGWTPDGDREDWYYGPLRPPVLPKKGDRTMDEAALHPVIGFLSEGPMTFEGVKQRCKRGRVIGIYNGTQNF